MESHSGHRYFRSAFTIRSQEYHDGSHTGNTASKLARILGQMVKAQEYQV